MPQTRSKIKTQRQVQVDDDDDSSATGSSIVDSQVEEHISQVQAGVQKLKRRLKTLLRENKNLRIELESKSALNKIHYRRSPQEDDSESRGTRIQELEKTVQALKKENLAQKRRIGKYKAEQLRAEARDLLPKKSDANTDKDEEIDHENRMRKLLRMFSDLMLVTTLPDDLVECPICYDKLELKKCSAFPCEHIVCNGCLPGISKGADETILCAECRVQHPRDDVELVHMTETQRWDELLKVAQAWDAFDANTRGELETSEEEAEDNFLTDGDGMTEDSSEMGNVEDPSFEHEASTPPPVQRQAYSNSPTKQKRRILEELAEARDTKRRK
ncbi:hypothetical protein BYT27DRAFT_7335534 [Phlegmacium glaucopus]|nr:hypothetical protein BYT27DRAFT_7335534 [Phlegmacium glaucopus]